MDSEGSRNDGKIDGDDAAFLNFPVNFVRNISSYSVTSKLSTFEIQNVSKTV